MSHEKWVPSGVPLISKSLFPLKLKLGKKLVQSKFAAPSLVPPVFFVLPLEYVFMLLQRSLKGLVCVILFYFSLVNY